MKFLRKKIAVRLYSIVMIMLVLIQGLWPVESYALTSGPHQPEYTSYEDASATDMVNLLTGDFTYNVPILSVPVGEEGSFTVPLSYHAGIGPEQEASWVGLGWNMNVGAITRTINGYPDDAEGEGQDVRVTDPGHRGWYSQSPFHGTIGWDSNIGHFGAINLSHTSATWDKNGTTVGVGMGIYVGKNSRFSVEEAALDLVEIVAAILTEGYSTILTTALQATLGDMVQSGAVNSSFKSALSPTAKGYWDYNRQWEKQRFLHTNYWIWLDKTRNERMYGILNLDKPYKSASTSESVTVNGVSQNMKYVTNLNYDGLGSASDINIDLSLATNYWDNHSPTLLATDQYYVSGQGISGSIKPYRLEIGSVSVPREMTASHSRFDPVPFLDYGSSKVPFVYEGAPHANYFNHVGGASSVSSPSFYYGISHSTTFQLSDVIFSGNERIRGDIANQKAIPQASNVQWLTNQEIKNASGGFANSAYLDYFSAPGPRQDFRDKYTFGYGKSYVSSFVEPGYGGSTTVIHLSNSEGNYFVTNEVVNIRVVSGADATGQTSEQQFPATITSASADQITVDQPFSIEGDFSAGYVEITPLNPKKRNTIIGGFVITRPDGMSYHYAIPVYDYNQEIKTINKADNSKSSTISRPGQFANTWLLTAITGPDFVDRGGANGGNGIVDDSDWGYWVKFNYGSHLTNYMWRFPYTENTTLSDPTNLYNNYSKGYKEKYYLNSIETRSHVAVFIKDSRHDAKDASASKLPSLRLAEIALLSKKDYKALTDPLGSYQLKNCSGSIDGTYHTGVNDNNSDAADNITGNKYDFIRANASRRIVFNHDYSLCPGVLNSDPGYGKLTLTSVSVFGRNDAKVLPDYKFSYSNNPSYHPDNWDGWGMYKSGGTPSGLTHQASPTDADGTAWSLTSILSPLGDLTQIEYERDRYSSVSNAVWFPAPAGVITGDQNVSDGVINGGASGFEQGERVIISQEETWVCRVCGDIPCTDASDIPGSYTNEVYGTVQGNDIILDEPLPTASNISCDGGTVITSTWEPVQVRKIALDRKGGNIRVKSITMSDLGVSGNQKKVRYLYTIDSDPWSTSSGVVSKEPEYIKTGTYTFDKWLGYPNTPVMYGRVTVLTGNLSTVNDYDRKEVYEFETPSTGQYSVNLPSVIANNVNYSGSNYRSLLKYEITRQTSKIGKLKSIAVYGKQSELPVFAQTYQYTSSLLNNGSNNYQGVFSEGTLLFEKVVENNRNHYKGQRTTVLDQPYVLQKVTTTKDGFTTETENKSWDFITGAVLESISKKPSGLRTKTVLEPAYTKYPEMGSKATNPANKNMLSQMAARYIYRIDASNNETGLISGEAITWKSNWNNYRSFDPGMNSYVEGTDIPATPVWRKTGTYIYLGDYASLQSDDGSLAFDNSKKFDFAGSLKPGWRQASEIKRYDHFSLPVEIYDPVGKITSAVKRDFSDYRILVSATNAAYSEFAYSGAEDGDNNSVFFGGEVARRDGVVVAGSRADGTVHTGKNAIQLTAGSKSFIYSPFSVQPGKKYRVMVWTNSLNGAIYFKTGDGGGQAVEQIISPLSTNYISNASTWYKIAGEITLPEGTNAFEIGVKSVSGTVLFDDFRLQPADAEVTAYVYNPSTGYLEYVLGTDNTYTRYEYNDKGEQVRIFSETIRYHGEKLVTETKQDFRRFHIDN